MAFKSTNYGAFSQGQQSTKQSGRPVRGNAGYKKNTPGYVDSNVIEDDDSFPSCSSDAEGNPIQPRRTVKRKRSPSPTPPPLDPIIYNDEPDAASDGEGPPWTPRKPLKKRHITLNLSVADDYRGAITLNFGRFSAHASDGTVIEVGCTENGEQTPKQKKLTTKAHVSPKPVLPRGKGRSRPTTHVSAAGFTTLPPELRNKIYRLLLVDANELKFAIPTNFQKSAALLRTCKLVHQEGASILYGENRFVFERNRHTRSPFWDPVPKEIGYKDVRQFLKMIGPMNISYLRDIRISFEDANPSSTPYIKSYEDRRYLNDEHLFDVLRILRDAPLRRFSMGFLGRRTLYTSDMRFLGSLALIQADDIEMSDLEWFSRKIASSVEDNLKKSMTRKPRLYLTK